MKILEDENNDYFDGPDIPDEPQKTKEPKKPTLKPEDPRYWDQDENEFEHLKPSGSKKIWLWWLALAGVVCGLLIAAYIYWFTPYATGCVQYGYVEDVEERGSVFKTFEGVLLPYKNLMDTTRVYTGDFIFSTKDSQSAVMLRKMQYANRPVKVVYKKYHSSLPWRGDSKYIIVRVDTVNPRNILPPDRWMFD